MKRSAAILGPTPSFVRWAIRCDCSLRQNDVKNVPDAAFRQLRGVRELSEGIGQSRVISGVCVHPEFNKDAETAKGFFADEIVQVFGGEDFVRQSCVGCVANAVGESRRDSGGDNLETWAGCFGWFPSKFGTADYVRIFDESSPRVDWYKLWIDPTIKGDSASRLVQILEMVYRSSEGAPDHNLLELLAASRLCVTHGLDLETELVPPGFSDGSIWTIVPHCSHCKRELTSSSKHCPSCGSVGSTHPAIKRNVLGLRPYGLLSRLVGMDATKEILDQFHDRSSHASP